MKTHVKQGISANNVWVKVCTIAYTSYNYLRLIFNYRCGYVDSGIGILRIRYGASGAIASGDSYLGVISTAKSAAYVRVAQETTTAVTLWLNCYGTGSLVGIDIWSVQSESKMLDNFSDTSKWTFHNFTETTTAPTAFVATTLIN